MAKATLREMKIPSENDWQSDKKMDIPSTADGDPAKQTSFGHSSASTPPLSDAAVEQWERDHADLEAAQAKTKRPKSLLEDEE